MAINSLSYYNNCNSLVSVTKECLLMTRGHMLNVFAPVLDRQGWGINGLSAVSSGWMLAHQKGFEICHVLQPD